MKKLFGKALFKAMEGHRNWVGSYTKNKIDGKRYCLWCGKDLTGYQRKYCVGICNLEFWQRYKGEFVWEYIREKIFKRDNFTCQKCHTQFDFNDLECHHITPRCKGGKDTDDNLMTLCKKCHREETTLLLQDRLGKVADPRCRTLQEFL